MMNFFRIPAITELEKALGLPVNSVAIASRQSKGGEGKTYAIAFFDHEVGKDFPDFALKNTPIGVVKATIKGVIANAKASPEEIRQGVYPVDTFRQALAFPFLSVSPDQAERG